MIVGQPGAGKSTVARAMGDLLDLPVFHVDKIHWQEGWIERSDEDKDRLCSEVHGKACWVFEGGRSSTRLERADTLVWLDFSLTVRAYRVFRRTLQYHGKTRPDLPDGCPERFNMAFSKWIWNTRKTGRQRLQQLYDSASSDVEKFRLMNQQQVDEFIIRLGGR